MKIECRINKMKYETDLTYYCNIGQDYCNINICIEINKPNTSFDYDKFRLILDRRFEGSKSIREAITRDIKDLLVAEIGLMEDEITVTTFNTRKNDRYKATVVC